MPVIGRKAKSVAPLPLGVAVMELRDATRDLSASLQESELQKTLESRTRLSEAIYSYEISRSLERPISFVIREWISIGDLELTTAHTILKTAASQLSSSLKLI
jgi:hypothetical protein